MSHFQPNLSRPMPACSTTTWRRFQCHAPPTHRIHERGRCRGGLRAQLYGVEAAVESTHCGIRHDHVCFLLSTKRHSTSDNSCCTSSFGHADRAISIISMTPRYDPICFGVACRTRGILRNSLYSGGCRGPKAIDSFSNSILGDAHNFLTHTTKKHKMFTAVVHKDADHTRTPYCCHDAVIIGKYHQSSPSRLGYHVFDLVAISAILS